MAKRILVSSTDLMMVQFLLPHIKHLSENGYIVDIACSNVGERVEEIKEKTSGIINNFHLIGTVRSPLSLKNLKGYKDMKNVIENNNYDYIWTNEPVMGVVTRLAARKKRKAKTLRVLYMAHGFHFYKGAPIINWLLFYPIEYLASFMTDMLVTINIEDFERSKKLHAKKVKYIHGIGINTERLSKIGKTDIRKELGLNKDSFLVLSVGELNKNKNQKVIIKALGEIKNDNIHYVLCGKGAEKENLENLAKECGIENNTHFLGYRNDVVDICTNADLFVMPTYREGLGLAALEAMYCSLTIIGSNNRGLKDIVVEDQSGYLCGADDYHAFKEAILKMYNDKNKRIAFGRKGKEIAFSYEIDNVKKEVLNLLTDLGD